ncbi:MAG: hypothetical protein ACOYOP_16065 [Microthrixaceae bacterium]
MTEGATTTARPRRPRRLPWGWPVAGLLALLAAAPLSDNSFLTHLATGRVLLADGLPATNPFLRSGGDFPVPSWWWSGALAVAERVGDGTAIRLLVVALAAVLGALLVRLVRAAAPEASPVAVLVPVSLVVLCLLPFLTPRPHLAGFLLLALALVVVGERRSAWWLVPVLATWVNVHGTWLYGLVVLALLCASDVIDGPRAEWDRRAALRRSAAVVGAAVLGTVIGGALYPDRFRLVGLPFEQFGDERARMALAGFSEWQPAGASHPLTWVLVALGLMAVVATVRTRRWAAACSSVVLLGFGLSAGRLLPVAAIVLLPWAAGALGGAPSPSAGPAGGAGVTARAVTALRVVGAALGIAAVGVAVATPAYDLSAYPVAAVDWLDARGLVGDPSVVLVSHDYTGNYLEFRDGPGARVWVDDRPGDELAIAYATLNHLRPGWRDALDRSRAQVVLWNDTRPLTAELARDPGWVTAARLDGFTVFCRAPMADRCATGP